ncbi:hypothetical protein ENBRE01_0470 [Enteropsectra breve]|nr:hypothetical protein ENBRE01_0470 [Enteropsectra breve]
MELEQLLKGLASDPSLIAKIEEEVQRIVCGADLTTVVELSTSKSPTVQFYVCKILELRIKKLAATSQLSDEINFVTGYMKTCQLNQLLDVYSLLALYCWPLQLPNFLNDVAERLNTKEGYLIFHMFLEKINTSSDIDEKRREELKKAIGLIYKELLQKFNDSFAKYIIPIYTELLKIVPKNFDFGIVFKSAGTCPDEVIDFVSEGASFISMEDLALILDELPVDVSILQVLTTSKLRNIANIDKIYSYVYKAIDDSEECFVSALDFWGKILSSSANASMVPPVLQEVTRVFVGLEDEQKSEVESYVFGFYSVVAKNHSETVLEFLRSNERILPNKISTNLLNKIYKVQKYVPKIAFGSPFLNCLQSSLQQDLETPALVKTLNLQDKDAVRLAIQILSKHEFAQEELMTLAKLAEQGCITAVEIYAECMVRLGYRHAFTKEHWEMRDVLLLYYFLKKDYSSYAIYKEAFYKLFLQNAPFDRCFAILERFGSIPSFILEDIYQKIDKYPFMDLCCFNNDLLPHLSVYRPFVEKEVLCFITEWNTITNHREYYQSLKSLLTIFESKIAEEGMIDLLMDLVQIDYTLILNKILSIFNNYRGSYNTRKAVYFLISAYTTASLVDSQPQISSSLTCCMYQPDGPEAFSEIIGLEISKCVAAKNNIGKSNKKTAQNIVRNLIKDYKVKTLNRLYENTNKITKQNFLSTNKSDSSFIDSSNSPVIDMN